MTKVSANSSSAMVTRKPSVRVERDRGRGDGDDAQRRAGGRPRRWSANGGLSPARTSRTSAERHHQADDELRQHAGAGRGQRAERQIAADGQHERAGDDERAAGDMIPAQGRRPSGQGRFLRHLEVPQTLSKVASSTRPAPARAEAGRHRSGRSLLRPHVLAIDAGDDDRLLHRVAAEGLAQFLVEHRPR